MALLRYLLRRLVTMVLTLVAISALVFFIIKLPPGDYLTNQIAELARGRRRNRASQRPQFLRHQFGLDLPVWQQYLVLGRADARPERLVRPASRQLGLVLRIQPAGERRRRPGPRAHSRGQPRGGHLRPYRGDPDRHLFGGAPIFARRLPRHLHRLYRARDAELPPRARASLLPQPLVRRLDRRPDGSRLRGSGLERRTRCSSHRLSPHRADRGDRARLRPPP